MSNGRKASTIQKYIPRGSQLSDTKLGYRQYQYLADNYQDIFPMMKIKKNGEHYVEHIM